VPIAIYNQTRQTSPKVKFDLIEKAVLGEGYDLSLVFCGHTTSRRLNSTLRGKDKPTNVLSFPLSKTSGEIFIDLSKVRAEQKKFGMKFSKLVAYLFIHGCLHLKGMSHGDKMEKTEAKLLKQFYLQ